MSKKTHLTSTVLFFGTIFLFLLSYKIFFFGGQSYEFCHYAEIASNIVKGKGFTSKIFAPSELALFNSLNIHVGEVGPVTWRSPFYAYWCSLWMRLFSISDFAMAFSNGMIHALWVVLIFQVGKQLLSFQTGVLAAVLWAINPYLLVGHDLYGDPDLLFGFLFLAFNTVWWASVPEKRLSQRGFLAVGFLAGAVNLVRVNFILFVPIYVVHALIVYKKKSAAPLACFLSGILVVEALSFLLTSYPGRYIPSQLAAWSLSSLTIASQMPWAEYRVFPLNSLLNGDAGILLIQKAWRNFGFFIRDFPSYWLLGVLFPFFLCKTVLSSRRNNLYFLTVFAMLFLQAFFFSFLRYEKLGFLDGRYFLWFAPYVLLYGVSFFVDGKWPYRKLAGTIVLVFLFHQWAGLYLLMPKKFSQQNQKPIFEWSEIHYIKENIPELAWVLTNIPTQIAWYAGKRTINIPVHLSDVDEICKVWKVDYIFLLNHRIGEIYNYPEWNRLLTGRDKISAKDFFSTKGFQLLKVFDTGFLYRRKIEKYDSSG